MKKYLLITLMAIALSATAQQTPTNKIRSSTDYSQVDNYLVALKRLGIPTSDSDNLDAGGLPQNTAKIIFNTTLGRLRVYNPIAGTWADATAVDMAGYYTKDQINNLLAGYLPLEGGALSGTLNITDGDYSVTALPSGYLAATNIKSRLKVNNTLAAMYFGYYPSEASANFEMSEELNGEKLLNIFTATSSDSPNGNGVQRGISWHSDDSGGIRITDNISHRGLTSGEVFTPVAAEDYVQKEYADKYWGKLANGDNFTSVQTGLITSILGKDQDGTAYLFNKHALRVFADLDYNLANDVEVLHKRGIETRKGSLFITNELDTNSASYLFAQDYNTGLGVQITSDGAINMNANKPTDTYGGLRMINSNVKGNVPIILSAGSNIGYINYTAQDYYPNANNSLELRNTSAGSDASIVIMLDAKGNSIRLDSAGVGIYRLERKLSFDSPLLTWENGRLKTVKDSVRLSPSALNSHLVGNAASFKISPPDGGSVVGARHEIGFNSWNASGTAYGIGGRVTSTDGNETNDLYLYNAGAERLIIEAGGKVKIPGVTEVANDVELTDPTKGVILKSPNGTRYRVTISDAGDFVKTAL
ncbi:hypothetical protein G7074_15840 [Pedobacter sp. HDW13]|uniref:hypothetical protein n=1 Tax=Pedobacter sp. HDW13 TaxID=2714940 RepID=UPI00140D927E|nr:hypothetical protein [Pedobacter sp. HDW13]QIL40608.1 hypothetical protein G7074_15840 [Pedobacter sp. HDW13]